MTLVKSGSSWLISTQPFVGFQFALLLLQAFFSVSKFPY